MPIPPAHIHLHISTYTHTHIHLHAFTHPPTHIHTSIHTSTYTFINPLTHSHIHLHTSTYTFTHPPTHIQPDAAVFCWLWAVWLCLMLVLHAGAAVSHAPHVCLSYCNSCGHFRTCVTWCRLSFFPFSYCLSDLEHTKKYSGLSCSSALSLTACYIILASATDHTKSLVRSQSRWFDHKVVGSITKSLVQSQSRWFDHKVSQ